MRSPIIARSHLVALALSAAVAPGPAPAQEAIPIRSDKAIKALPVRAPLEAAEAKFTDVILHLIGAPGSDSLGISIRATVVPKLDLTGKEKAVLYFYATCDDEPPAQSAGVLVATLELGDLPAGRVARTIVTTGTVSALVPLSNVACAKLSVMCKECAPSPPPPAAFTIRRLDAPLDAAVQDVSLEASSLALVGEPASKSFGITFRGTVSPTVELTGKEKAVIRLYTGCAGTGPPEPDATNVATVELGSLRKGRDRQGLTTTKDATAFVPMQDIGCAKLSVVCEECAPSPPPPAAFTIRRLDAPLDAAVQDFRLDAPSLALIGEPASKSFGIAFRGTVLPTAELTGEEKAVIRLYTGCAGSDPPPGRDATNVATVELSSLRKGSDRRRLTVTKDATAFVPMQDIGCAVVDMDLTDDDSRVGGEREQQGEGGAEMPKKLAELLKKGDELQRDYEALMHDLSSRVHTGRQHVGITSEGEDALKRRIEALIKGGKKGTLVGDFAGDAEAKSYIGGIEDQKAGYIKQSKAYWDTRDKLGKLLTDVKATVADADATIAEKKKQVFPSASLTAMKAFRDDLDKWFNDVSDAVKQLQGKGLSKDKRLAWAAPGSTSKAKITDLGIKQIPDDTADRKFVEDCEKISKARANSHKAIRDTLAKVAADNPGA